MVGRRVVPAAPTAHVDMARQNATLLLLTALQARARSFLGALDQVLDENHQSSSKNWGIVRDIAQTTLLAVGGAGARDQGVASQETTNLRLIQPHRRDRLIRVTIRSQAFVSLS